MRFLRSWCISCLLAALSLVRAATDGATPVLRLRVQTYARETVPVINPVRWALFTQRVPEGTRVEEGDPLFHIDMSGPESRRISAENRLKEARNRAEYSIGSIEDQITALEDQRAERLDARRVLEARRVWQQSLPREEDVAIAEGRLEVARRNLDAARKEWTLAQERKASGLISAAAVEDAEQAFRMQEARVRHAQSRLATTRQPAHPDEIRLLDLRILNVDREIAKLEGEIQSKRELLRIERAARVREIEGLEAERDEAVEELRHEVVRSPRAGVVLYTPSFKRDLATGGQPGKGANIAEIPIPESIALRGSIPEQFRPLFRPGDPVRVRLNAAPERELAGTLASLSPYSKDALDGENTQGSGVKWVEVVITLTQLPADFPLGVYGEAWIEASSPRSGPSLPLEWVRFRDGKSHLALNGRYQPVEGEIVGGQFILDPPYPPLESISATGEWPTSGETSSVLDTDRFTASGELMPLESASIVVPRVRTWDLKIAWLHPENEWVTKGTKIAELDSERTTSRLRDTQRDLKRAQEEREAAEEDVVVKRRDAEFRVAVAETQLDIRRLELGLVEKGINASALQQARLDVEIARIQLEAGRRALERARTHPELTAPAELRRLERELRRRELQAERAGLQLAIVSRGADPVQRSLARLEVLRQDSALAELRATTGRSVAGAETALRNRIRNERNRRDRLQRARLEIESMTLTAPFDGLLKYETVWDGVGRSKIRAGLGTWSGTPILALSDSRRLVVRVAVPERHVSRLQTGMAVQVRIPSEGNRSWVGEVHRLGAILEPAEATVLRASPYANREPPHEQVIRVDILLEETPSAPLKPGAIAHVVFPFPK